MIYVKPLYDKLRTWATEKLDSDRIARQFFFQFYKMIIQKLSALCIFLNFSWHNFPHFFSINFFCRRGLEKFVGQVRDSE